jgi:hypothetical protein
MRWSQMRQLRWVVTMTAQELLHRKGAIPATLLARSVLCQGVGNGIPSETHVVVTCTCFLAPCLASPQVAGGAKAQDVIARMESALKPVEKYGGCGTPYA